MSCPVKVTVGNIQTISVTSSEQTAGVYISSPIVPLSIPYTGEYEFTPSETEQIIRVSGTTPSQNIKINPIPNNYGLITWNGAYLFIS